MSSDAIANFCGITGATTQVAKKFLDKYKRLDVAVDAYYNNPTPPPSAPSRQTSSAPSMSKLNALFDKYKDPDVDEIAIDGTIRWCEDLGVDPEDVVLLAIAHELKSPQIGQWSRKGWTEGWKRLGSDSIEGMQAKLNVLRDKLGQDPAYFKQVYLHTFDFARAEGQRILTLETAQGYWALLLPHGLRGGALQRIRPEADGDGDENMEELGPGFKEEYVSWWLEFLAKQGGKGVTKDTWTMFLEFIRTIDAQFKDYDETDPWPSAIDEFVLYARKRIASG